MRWLDQEFRSKNQQLAPLLASIGTHPALRATPEEDRASGWRLVRRGVIVDVALLPMPLVFIRLAVVVAVRQGGVVVRMGMPVRAVLPLIEGVVGVVM